MNNPSTNWEDYESKYKPMFANMMHYIEHQFEPRLPPTSSLSATISYIQAYGLDMLSKVLFKSALSNQL
jgi:hypothetical protein